MHGGELCLAGLSRCGWVDSREGFRIYLRLIFAIDSDPERLEVLARIALRLSAMPGCECAANLLPPLVKRMTVLDPTNTLGKVSDATIEHLFRASLSLEPQHMRQEVVEAVKEVGWRIKRLQREIGEWVRRETRRAEWDAMRSKPE